MARKTLLNKYPDTLEFVRAHKDGYGDETIAERVAVKCVFVQTTGWQRGSYSNPITSDAIAYVDHMDEWVIANAYRLEEFKVVANPFNSPERLAWYKVSSSIVGKRPLVNNTMDNVQINLDKTVEIKGYTPS